MKIKMAFKLPKEEHEYKMVKQATQLASALDDILEELRSIYKYSDNSNVVVVKNLPFWKRLLWAIKPNKYVLAEIQDAYDTRNIIHNILNNYNIDLE